MRHHLAAAGALGGGGLALVAGRRRLAAALGAGWVLDTAAFTWRRVRPGPRSGREWATMAVTSALIPPAAVAWRLAGWTAARRPTRHPVAAVLFDRDGTLVDDVPYNGDPRRVRLRAGAERAVTRARAAGAAVGLITNQSGVARGLLTPQQVEAVNARLQELLGPFDVIAVCPHSPGDGCGCRKPLGGMVLDAARRLGVDPRHCWVVGDIAADVQAAHHAGARAVLVPTEVTLRQEIRLAPHVAADLDGALDIVFGPGR
jgi:histidinol-phosphate phosphatase family protein